MYRNLFVSKMKFLGALFLLLVPCFCFAQNEEEYPFRNPALSAEERATDLVSRLTLDEKVMYVTGVMGSDVRADVSKRLNVPYHMFKIAHGPYGLSDRYLNCGFRVGTCFPVSAALAATWNTDLVYDVYKIIGYEAHQMGASLLAGPAMNIVRDPRCGRNFEYYTEDPYLNAEIATAAVNGLQSQRVGATIKHFACNNQEVNRFDLNVNVSERALREIYLPGYEKSIVEGKAQSVMSAYNTLNGTHCGEQYHLLKEILRDEWKFEGFVMSDWGGTVSTLGSIKAGLDKEMPSERWYGIKLKQAIKDGLVDERIVDTMVYRIFKAFFWSGLFDEKLSYDEKLLNTDSAQLIAYRAAAEAAVLLKNDRSTLPFNIHKGSKIAVIGPLGDFGPHYNRGIYSSLMYQGFGSAHVEVPREQYTTPYQGIKERFQGVADVAFEPGCNGETGFGAIPLKYLRTPDGKNQGFYFEYFDNPDFRGNPVKKGVSKDIFYKWKVDGPIPERKSEDAEMVDSYFSAVWSAILTPPETLEYAFQTRNYAGDVKVYLNGDLLFENLRSNRTNCLSGKSVQLNAGESYELRIEYIRSDYLADLQFGWDYANWDYLKRALELARQADVVILNVGLTGDIGEGESSDRLQIKLPECQERLIREVAKVNAKCVVAISAGSAIDMVEWIDSVPSVMMTWYAGQEGAYALADLISGKISPSGRLPVTFPVSLSQYPFQYHTFNKNIDYKEDIFVGYRYFDQKKISPLYSFGYGLSYTRFKYGKLKIDTSDFDTKGVVHVHVCVKNIGQREGKEVVQLYVRDLKSTLPRPQKELKGLKKISIAPGETVIVSFDLDRRAFAYWNDGWTVEPGRFRILVGGTSSDLYCSQTIVL